MKQKPVTRLILGGWILIGALLFNLPLTIKIFSEHPEKMAYRDCMFSEQANLGCTVPESLQDQNLPKDEYGVPVNPFSTFTPADLYLIGGIEIVLAGTAIFMIRRGLENKKNNPPPAKIPDTRVKCPGCLTVMPQGATICRGCGRDIPKEKY